MTKQGHTPGPWWVTGMFHDRVHSARGWTAEAGNEADARLIAAAPELLAALKSVMADLDHYAATHGPGPDRRRDAARAAIAKATGR